MSEDHKDRLREAVTLFRRVVHSPLFGLLPANYVRNVEAINEQTTNERLQIIVADPERLEHAASTLGPLSGRLHEFLRLGLVRLQGVGWDLDDDAQVERLSTMGAAEFRRVYADGIGPDEVTVGVEVEVTVEGEGDALTAALEAARESAGIVEAVAAQVNEPTAVRLRRAASAAASFGAPTVAERLLKHAGAVEPALKGTSPLMNPTSNAAKVSDGLASLKSMAVADGATTDTGAQFIVAARVAFPPVLVNDVERAYALALSAAETCLVDRPQDREAAMDDVEQSVADVAGEWQQGDRAGRAAMAEACFNLSIALLEIAAECGDPEFDVDLPPNLTGATLGGEGPAPGPSVAEVEEGIEEARTEPPPVPSPHLPKAEPKDVKPVPHAGVAPTAGEILVYIEVSEGDLKDTAEILADAYDGWHDRAAILAGARQFARNVAEKSARFSLWFTTAPLTTLLTSEDSFWDASWVLSDAGANQIGAAEWHKIAVPIEHEQKQHVAWRQIGAEFLDPDAFDKRSAVSGATETQAEDVVVPPTTTMVGHYVIEDLAGEYAVSLDSDAYDAIVLDKTGALSVSSPEQSDDVLVSNGFGTVALTPDADTSEPYLVSAWNVEDEEVTQVVAGFLADLEQRGIVQPRGPLRVTDLLANRAAVLGDVTPEGLAQAIKANEALWSNKIGAALNAEFNLVFVDAGAAGMRAEWIGPMPAVPEVRLSAQAADDGHVSFAIAYEASDGWVFDATGVTSFAEFADGAPIFVLEEEGVRQGFFAVDEEIEPDADEEPGVAVPTTTLSQDGYDGLLADFGRLVEEQLQQTAPARALLTYAAAEEEGIIAPLTPAEEARA